MLDRAAMVRAFDAAENAFGTVTILLNNAGIPHADRVHEMPEETWRNVLGTNLDAVLYWAQEAARRMIAAKKQGAIVNIASILGFNVSKGVAAYAVAKAGVVQLTRALALELSFRGVRVNAIAPGFFATEINEQYLKDNAAMARSIPAGRIGEVRDLDGVLLLLCPTPGALWPALPSWSTAGSPSLVRQPDGNEFYDCATAPSPRRVRIFLAEKGISIETVQVDLRNGEQFTDAFRAINPDCTVPALALDDGTVIADAVAICGYIEELHPDPPLIGATPQERAAVTALNRQIERDGFFAAMDAFRNAAKGLKGRALPGPHDYEQIPELAERGRARIGHFFKAMNARLADREFVAGERYTHRRYFHDGAHRYGGRNGQARHPGGLPASAPLVRGRLGPAEREGLICRVAPNFFAHRCMQLPAGIPAANEIDPSGVEMSALLTLLFRRVGA